MLSRACLSQVPIPGVKNVAQAREIIGACGWRLGPTDVEVLDERMDFFEKQNRGAGVLGVPLPDIKAILGGGGEEGKQ